MVALVIFKNSARSSKKTALLHYKISLLMQFKETVLFTLSEEHTNSINTNCNSY
jgi:hypothetical protein